MELDYGRFDYETFFLRGVNNNKWQYFGFYNDGEYSDYTRDSVKDLSFTSWQRWTKFGDRIKNVGSGKCLAYGYNKRYLFIIKIKSIALNVMLIFLKN